MAKALGVRVDDLLLETRQATAAAKQPVGEIQRTFDQVRQLPRSQQRKVVEIVSALLDQYRRKAG
jgi:predicted trehalose synthase